MLQVHQNLDALQCVTSSSSRIELSGAVTHEQPVKHEQSYVLAWIQTLLSRSGSRIIKHDHVFMGAYTGSLSLAVCVVSDRLRLQIYRLSPFPGMDGLEWLSLMAMKREE